LKGKYCNRRLKSSSEKKQEIWGAGEKGRKETVKLECRGAEEVR